MPSRQRTFATLLAASLGFGLALASSAAPPPVTDPDFVTAGRLDASIPAPGPVIGHAVGADAVRYLDMVRYLRALADASEHVTLGTHGTTHEGRTLYHLVITSTANHARLDDIRAGAAKLADPRRIAADDEATALLDDLPGIAWLGFSIHGDEVSPCDSALVVAYRLAAGMDAATKRLRDDLVVIVDPLQNPDGRERYLAQIQALRGKVPNPDIAAMQHAGLWSAGRGNHYLFDMNRDWLPQVQPETRGRTAAILDWNPHLLVDAHEMGGLDTYLFDPPREPINSHVAETIMAWRRQVSADHARAFNDFGWSYYTGEWYDEWYPGYTNAWANLVGAIGILYEQAGVNGAAVRQAAGNVLTYEEAVHHNVVSVFANIETLRTNRRQILADYLADRREAVSGTGPDHDTFLFPPDRDRARRRLLRRTLDLHHIEYVIAAAPVEAMGVIDVWGDAHGKVTLPAGTLVVDPAQPQRRLLHAILGFDPPMTQSFVTEEREDLERGQGTRMYDISAWNLPMAYGVEAYTASRLTRPVTAPPADARTSRERAGPAPPAVGAYGTLVPIDDSNVYPLLTRLLEHGAHPRIARKPFRHADRDFRSGAILLRAHEHGDDLDDILASAADGLELELIPAETALNTTGPDLGGREFDLLAPPRVAIASQWPISTTGFGAVWHLLDERIGLRTSPVNVQNLGRMDLRKYNVLILPSSSRLDGVLGAGGWSRLRTWVESGGTLIAIGSAAATLADERPGLSEVRRRRDALDHLDVYAEAVARERAARNVAVDVEALWDRTPAGPREGDAGAAEKTGEATGPPAPPKDADARRRADEWQRRFAPEGAIVAGRLDPAHWLGFGLDERLPLMISGSSCYLAGPPVQTAVRLEPASSLRLSGLLWPEARTRLGDSAYATVERVGNGQVILFASDPIFRGYWEGSGRLLLNATVLGPGLGTNQPLPW